jgi:hypothetical protein
MRLWSIHPKYLDKAGLVAAWREGLLAKKVLEGHTEAYEHHPQLERFRLTPDPVLAINDYLHALADQAAERGYKFDRTKLDKFVDCGWEMIITTGQMEYEWQHLLEKLETRDPLMHGKLNKQTTDSIIPHPMFTAIPGPKAKWEKQVIN